MGRLDLLFLGTPQVRHAGQVLVFPTRKVLALLIYLTVSGGLHPREQLTALLWPESAEGRARASFRRALSLLRQVLDETPGTSHLIVEGEGLGFDLTSDCTCDLHTLQAAAQATNVRVVLSSRSLLDQFQDAATLYRGEFLGTFSLPDAPDFDDWVRGQRAFWHRRMEALFDKLAQVQEEAGALADALETASRWRVCSPFNEQAYTRLMRLYFAAGDRGPRSRSMQTVRRCSQRNFIPCRVPKQMPWSGASVARLPHELARSSQCPREASHCCL